jgi:hypothetical protein
MKLAAILLHASLAVAAAIDIASRAAPDPKDLEVIPESEVSKTAGVCLNHRGKPPGEHKAWTGGMNRGECHCHIVGCISAGQQLGKPLGSPMVKSCINYAPLREDGWDDAAEKKWYGAIFKCMKEKNLPKADAYAAYAV